MKNCPYCESSTNDFIAANQTAEYSVIEIAINRQGMLRVRTFDGGDNFVSQNIIELKHCPLCGKSFRKI